MRIGELAARTGCTESQIRYYERRGVMPAPARSASGYRMYGAADEARLRLVARMKLLGLPLSETAELVARAEAGCCGQTDHAAGEALRRRVAEIDAQMAELARLRATLVEALDSGAGAGEGVQECGGAFCLPTGVPASGRRERPVVPGAAGAARGSAGSASA